MIRIRKSLIVFFTAGHPSVSKTVDFMLTAANAGADVVELGVPFSDPVADGKTIQESYVKALKKFRVDQVFDIAKAFMAECDKPLVLMSYYNPI